MVIPEATPSQGVQLSTPEHAHFPGMRAIVRHAVPNILISTVVPTSLFYIGWYSQGRGAAFALALGWALTLVAWRAVRRQRVPAMLVIGLVLLVVRTVVALMSNNTRFYFFQPVVTTCIVGAMFIVSMAAGRPLIGKLAGDLCPLSAEMTSNHIMQRHFRKLSFLWAGIYFCNAAVTMFLLMNVSVSTFVATHTFATLAITWSGLGLTTVWSRQALREMGWQSRRARAASAAAVPAAA